MEELKKEESHQVVILNTTNHLNANIEKLKQEKAALEARLEESEMAKLEKEKVDLKPWVAELRSSRKV